MTNEETARQVAQLLRIAADAINQAADKVAQIAEMENGQEVKANGNRQRPRLSLEVVREFSAYEALHGFSY